MPFVSFYELSKLLETGVSFSLSNEQYKKCTGYDIPIDLNEAAVIELAKEHGYRVREERILIFEKEKK